MITFNVVFTPGTPRRLLPFAVSLLQGSGVQLRLVANGCGPEEVEVLRAATQTDGRISHHVFPDSHPIGHGHALNRLFQAFPEPYFAIVDSDVLASGDFMPRLWPLVPGQAAVFAASPVWVTDDDAVAPATSAVLSGRQRVLDDGTPVGSTYLAIYDRAAVEPLWREAPRGFSLHHRYMLSRSLQAALAARGWRHRMFDTCRLINLQLLVAGFKPQNRAVPELHHVGGFSAADLMGIRPMLGTLLWILRSKDEPRLRHVADRVTHRLFLVRKRRSPERRRMNQRRRIVQAHVDAVLDALLAGEPIPATPRTDSAEVDRRVAALVLALKTHYGTAVGQ